MEENEVVLDDVKFIKIHGLHNIFDFSTQYKIAKFLSANNGYYTQELFKEDFEYNPDNIFYVLCDSTDEQILGERFVSGMTYILVQHMLLDTNSCRTMSIEDMKRIFGEGYYGYYEYRIYNVPDFIVGIGSWDKNI